MADNPSKRQRMEEIGNTGGPSSATVARNLPVDGHGESAYSINVNEIAKLKQIEVDSEDFSVIVNSGAFIDKSLFIKKICYQPGKKLRIKTVVITAPCKFGKSVNMDMLKRFFEIEVDKEGKPKINVKWDDEKKMWLEQNDMTKNFKLFRDNNLKIYQCQCRVKHTDEQMKSGQCASRQFFYKHCGQHPVLYVSFKKVKCDSEEKLHSSFASVLSEVAKEHLYLKDSQCLRESEKERFVSDYLENDETSDQGWLCDRLEVLVSFIYKHFNRKVILFIDEYDAPIMSLIHSCEEVNIKHIQTVFSFISTIISSVMKENSQVLGGLINARVVMATYISAYANNMEVYPFLEKHCLSEFYGFTEDEVRTLLMKPQFKDFDGDKVLDYYKGYQFEESGPKMYNVYSFVSFLNKWVKTSKEQSVQRPGKKMYTPENYWVSNFGIPALNKLFICEEFRYAIRRVLNHGSYGTDATTRLIPMDILTLNSFIRQHCTDPYSKGNQLFLMHLKNLGYFNVIEIKNYYYHLGIPSGEIQDELTRNFYDQEYYQKKYNFTPKQITDYCNALLSLDINKPETFKELANSIEQLYSEAIPMPKDNDSFKEPLIAFAFSMQNVAVKAHLSCQSGRNSSFDLLVHRNNDGTGIIMEFTCGSKENAEKGLKHIFENKCYEAFKLFGIAGQKVYMGLYLSELKKVSICAAITNSEEWDVVMRNVIRYPETGN